MSSASAWILFKKDVKLLVLIAPSVLLVNKLWTGNIMGDPHRSDVRYFPLREFEPRHKEIAEDLSGFADDETADE